jgi:hypothetical protein
VSGLLVWGSTRPPCPPYIKKTKLNKTGGNWKINTILIPKILINILK